MLTKIAARQRYTPMDTTNVGIDQTRGRVYILGRLGESFRAWWKPYFRSESERSLVYEDLRVAY